MLTIDCIFDEESGLDAADPLGILMISDGQSELRIHNTFLDSWLIALIDALHSLHALKQFLIEVPEEQKSIGLKVFDDGKIEMSYGGKTIVAGERSEFDRALRLAARKFLVGVDSVAAEPRNTDIAAIRRFAATTQN